MDLYTLQETSNPDIFRYVDFNGDWNYYYIKSKDKFVPAVNYILKTAYPKDYGFYQYLLSVSKEQSEKILQKAGDEGSRVHDVIKNVLGGHKATIDDLYPSEQSNSPQKLNFEEWRAILAWSSFVQDYKLEVKSFEETVATDWFAGTRDFIGVVTLPEKMNGKKNELAGKKVTVLLDWKKSGAIYDEYLAQTSAYWSVDKATDYTGIVRLGTRHANGIIDNAGYEVKLFNRTETEKNLDLFHCAYQIFSAKHEFELVNKSFPTEINITVPKVTPEPVKAPVKKRRVKKQNVTK